jgi:hypothetical protein
MKTLMTLALFMTSLAYAKTDGGNVGNGGDPIAIEFLQDSHKVVEDVTYEIGKFPELKNTNLHNILQALKISVTDEDLWVAINGQNQKSTAKNFPKTSTITINRALWNSIPTRDRKLSLAFHELLGLAGLEKSGEYSISQRYVEANLGNTELLATRSPRFLIPSSARSCGSSRQAIDDGTQPVVDINFAYFAVPTLYFFRSDSKNDLFISAIILRGVVPSTSNPSGNPFVCELAGRDLWALSNTWWKKKDAIIPANTGGLSDMFSTDCPLYCGGIDYRYFPGAVTVDIDVLGYEQDTQGKQTPVKFTRAIQITGAEQPQP